MTTKPMHRARASALAGAWGWALGALCSDTQPGWLRAWCQKRGGSAWGWAVPALLGGTGVPVVQRPLLGSTWPLSPLCLPCRQNSFLQRWCTLEPRNQQVSGAPCSPPVPVSQSRDCLWVWKGNLWSDTSPHRARAHTSPRGVGTATCPGLAPFQSTVVGVAPLFLHGRMVGWASHRPLPGPQAAGTHRRPICG